MSYLACRDAKVAWLMQETFATLKDWVRELRTQGPSNILIAVVGESDEHRLT